MPNRTKPLKPLVWKRADRESWEETGFYNGYQARYMSLPDPIDVPARLRKGVGRILKPGACHDSAAKYVLDHISKDGIRLCYGTYFDHYRHSWVELPGNIVFDGEMQEFYPADAYRAAYRCTVIREYTPQEVLRLMLDEGHFGPWEGNCR